MGVEISFGKLDRYSNQFVHMFIEKSLRNGDKICISLVNNIPQYLIALLGAMKIGCAITGIKPLLSEDQLIYQLKDVEAKGISPDFNYKDDIEALRNEITSWTKTKVSPYEVPKIIEIREEIHLTAVGKIDKKILCNEISRI